MCTSEVNTHTWTLDDNLQGSVLSFHRVAPRDQTGQQAWQPALTGTETSHLP